MGLTNLLQHSLHFVAPACAVGTLASLVGVWQTRKNPAARSLRVQALINSAAGTAGLLAGLWFFSNDGKMTSYAAMVLAVASAQWMAARA